MNGSRIQVVLQLLGIGWYVAICIGGGAFGGRWLDRQTDLSPVFTLLGLGLGIAVALVGMFRMLMAVLSSKQDDTDGRKE
jgi:hypothetical protein